MEKEKKNRRKKKKLRQLKCKLYFGVKAKYLFKNISRT